MFKRKRKRRVIVYGSVSRYGPQSVVNLLRWNATHVKNCLSQNCNIFSVLSISYLSINPGETNNKLFITSQQFLSSAIIPSSSKRKRRIIVYGLVTRYDPQSIASASDWDRQYSLNTKRSPKNTSWKINSFKVVNYFLFRSRKRISLFRKLSYSVCE